MDQWEKKVLMDPKEFQEKMDLRDHKEIKGHVDSLEIKDQ